MKLHIGLDDTDSPDNGCTTYLAARLVEDFLGLGATFIDYPTLLRLNPNTPWKTRGNASLCLRLEVDESMYEELIDHVNKLILENGEFSCNNTNPGAVFLKGDVPNDIHEYSLRVIRSIIKKEEALELIKRHGLDFLEYKNGRGIIGALAAIGGVFEDDFTYELLTYRVPENRGAQRRVSLKSIHKMNNELQYCTFNNIDESGKPLIMPKGSDPVLYGVRGESPEAVYNAMNIITPLEPVERWMICRTNQGTDQHFGTPIKVCNLLPHNPAVVQGIVNSVPDTIEGGHVFFKLKDESGIVDCAAFEPTGSFRDIIRELVPGDEVTAYSGVSVHKDSLTLNLEKIVINSMTPVSVPVKPRCPECGGSTESMGHNQGLRCKKCGYRNKKLVEEYVMVNRKIVPGIYLPDRSAHRHLTKPLERYGREKILRIEL